MASPNPNPTGLTAGLDALGGGLEVLGFFIREYIYSLNF
jgi:hypothetical protein